MQVSALQFGVLGLVLQTLVCATWAYLIPQDITPGPPDTGVFPPDSGSGGNAGGSGSGSGTPGSGGVGTRVKGLECGSVMQIYRNTSVQIFSTNFNLTNYYNKEVCNWKFEAHQCKLSMHCPCVDIPRSWECLGDYLKISSGSVLQNQRFCGGNVPGVGQRIYSDSDYLNIRFRSDAKDTATGFTCYIHCEGPGQPMGIEAAQCPAPSLGSSG